MAPTSASKRSSRASTSSSTAPTPKREATKPKGRVSTGKVSYAESDDDNDDAEPSSSDIDGSDFEESRQQEKRKAEQQQNGSSVKKARTAKSSGSGSDPDGDDDDGSDGLTDDDEDDEDAEDDDDASEEDEEETKTKGKGKYKSGVTVVRKVVKAPTTGLVPPGQISKNSLNFLADLAVPEQNDREWFWANEARYRTAHKEWVDFIDSFLVKLQEVDDEIPYLPAKDVEHRIYRDVRFSNDKTPYKRNLSASFSRTGRKGIFAHYHVMIMPNGRSIIAAGIWGPEKDQLALMRAAILRSSQPLRDVLSAPDFIAEFGEPKPFPPTPRGTKKKKKPTKKAKKKKGKDASSDEDSEEDSEEEEKATPERRQRRSVFGGEDALKVAPKGIAKDHPDIDLLKCRSIAVIKQFTDDQVLSPTWQDEVIRVVKVVQPFVRLLNEMVTIPDIDSDAPGADAASDEDE